MSDTKSPTRVLTEYPLYYPQRLLAETQVIIAAAVKKFPTLDLILPLVRYVVARMTPVMMRETSGVRVDLVLWHMEALVDSILIQHYLHDPNKRFDLKQVILKSDKWQALAKAVAKKCRAPKPEKQQQEPAPVPPVAVSAATASALTQELIQVNNTVYVVPQPARPTKKKRKHRRKPAGSRTEPAAASSAQSATDKAPPSRSELIDSKIEEVERETGRKINRKEFALVAGYTVRNLQLFQQGKATADVDRAFDRILNYPAKTIVEILDKTPRQ